MSSTGLRISRIELTCGKEVESAELTIDGQNHALARQPNSGVLSVDFDPVSIERASQGSFVLLVKYQGYFRQKSRKVEINSSEVLANSQDNEFRKVWGKFVIVLKLSVSPDFVPINAGPLPPTFESILKQCPRFRVLVIGKSGVGKSTLINHTFGIKNAFAEHDKRGKGFEQGEDDTLGVVTQFIKERRNNEDIKEQLHAVWLCFQIPNADAGQRMMEAGMEEFLQQKKEILGDVPTIFVFTKYDMLTTAVEDVMMGSVEDYTPTDVESKAKQLVEAQCVEPIKKLTKETSIPHIAVSEHRGKLEGLIQLTYEKVSEYFGNQPGTATSAVPTVAVMAQRVAPDLKIEGSIKVGKQRYWQAIFAGPVFSGRSMQDCLRVIHDDIIGLWNFCDEDKLLLSKEFREFMMNLVNLLDCPMDCPPLPQRSETMSSMQTEGTPLVAFLLITLPFTAGLKLVKWAHNIYKQTPEVQRNFIAYIADLTNVLDILFTLTASRSEENLNIRAIKAAYKAYCGSMRRVQVHAQIRGCSVSTFGSSDVVSEIVSLVRQRYVIDKELVNNIAEVSATYLEGEEAWYP